MSIRPSKALLCYHGTGAKGSIFSIQMARICYQLRDEFEFIFLDGPIEGVAGPGVLPMFDGHEPYYCWFAGTSTSIEDSMDLIHASVQQTVDDWKKSRAGTGSEIVGAIGFSEGALALLITLWQQQQRSLGPWLPKLQFAVLSCCFFPNVVSTWLNARAQELGSTKAYVDIPTLHIHGNRDFCLGRSRKLVRNHYRPKFATIVQTEAGHHLPAKKEEVTEVVRHILRLSQASAIVMPS